MERPAFAALLLVSSLSACDRGVGPQQRTVEVRGLPSCPPKTVYARPLVVRLDRDRALFDEPFSTQASVESSAIVALTVPRTRMHATVRVGICAPTSLATWDCAAASWVASTTLDLDARATTATVTLPRFDVPCGR